MLNTAFSFLRYSLLYKKERKTQKKYLYNIIVKREYE